MSGLSWTRKYRPMNLDSYVGNSTVKKKVASMFKNKRVPQTILLEGDRGCGKTTLARIMAKNLMCKSPKENGLACEECSVCKALNEKFILTGQTPAGLPVFEIDITKSNSKDEAAKIVEQMRIKPMGNQKKVYILDEIQRATKEAQNSFLKVTEEPGDYLYIILCTTNPEDLIEPFKSRFNSLKVRRPSVQDIVERLEYICREENIVYDEAALRLIVSQSNRIPRESINKLDMIAIGGKVTYDVVVEELQLVRVGLYNEYIDLLGKDIFEAMKFIDDLYEEHGVDWGDFLSQLGDYLLDAFNMKIGIRLEKYSEDDYKNVRKILKKYTVKDLARFLALLKEALKIKHNPRYALTMLTLEMGYPEYVGIIKKEEVQEEIKKESKEAMMNYIKKKKESKKKQEETREKFEEMSEEDFLNLLPGTEVVDLNFLDEEGE